MVCYVTVVKGEGHGNFESSYVTLGLDRERHLIFELFYVTLVLDGEAVRHATL